VLATSRIRKEIAEIGDREKPRLATLGVLEHRHDTPFRRHPSPASCGRSLPRCRTSGACPSRRRPEPPLPPRAGGRKRPSPSPTQRAPLPSAMLSGTESAARRSWSARTPWLRGARSLSVEATPRNATAQRYTSSFWKPNMPKSSAARRRSCFGHGHGHVYGHDHDLRLHPAGVGFVAPQSQALRQLTS
jgi:hypothetical protein